MSSPLERLFNPEDINHQFNGHLLLFWGGISIRSSNSPSLTTFHQSSWIVQGGGLDSSQSYKCNTRKNKFVISLQGWSVAGEELSHIVCGNQVENEQ